MRRHPDARRRHGANGGRILNGDLEAGAIIGDRYRIVAPLARGGFGAVYVAEQMTTERRVALKVLVRYAEFISVEQLLTEARVTSRLYSDHIVQVIDAGVDVATSAVFVVMELLSGMTLDERVTRGGVCSPQETAEYLRQVAAGLDKAHGCVDRAGRPAPIVHRDLKPSNLFLSQRDDGQPLIKILDFGIAKVLSQTSRTSGLVRGTPQYMASEQATGDPCTEATDIWALGLIAFFLLTGRSYWLAVEHEGSQARLFAEILTLPLVPASRRAREIGAAVQLTSDFDSWFERCVNRDAAQRFRSAGSAARELARALGVTLRSASESEPAPRGEPTLADTEAASAARLVATQAPADEAPARRRRPGLGLATLGIALAGGGGVLAMTLWQGRTARPHPVSAPLVSDDRRSEPSPRQMSPSPSPSLQPSSLASAARPAASVERPATAPPRAPTTAGKKRTPSSAATASKSPQGTIDVYEQR